MIRAGGPLGLQGREGGNAGSGRLACRWFPVLGQPIAHQLSVLFRSLLPAS